MRIWNIEVEPVAGGAIVTARQVERSPEGESLAISEDRGIVSGDPATYRFNARMRKYLVALVKEAFPKEEKPATPADVPGQQPLPLAAVPPA